MPININYQPSAAAIGGAGLMAGNADFNRWRAQQLAQQWAMGVGAAQNAQQMNLSRMNALSQIAAGQQNQQQQQAFEQQMLPQRAALDAQSQAFQSNLAGQNQTNQALLQGSLHAQQSTQDFGEQQSLQNLQNQQQMERDQAQRQAQVEGQQTVAAYNDRIKQGLQDRAMMQNPLQQHMQMMEQAQKSGYSFTPDENTQVKQIKSDIGAIQQAVSDNTLSMGDAIKQMKPAVSRLNSITPSQSPPKTVDQVVTESMTWGWKDPQTGQIKPGTEDIPFTLNKDGKPRVAEGYKMDAGGEVVGPDGVTTTIGRADKLEGLKGKQAKNAMAADDYADKQMEKEAKRYMMAMQPYGADRDGNMLPGTPDPTTGQVPVNPETGQPMTWLDERHAFYEKKYHGRTGGQMQGVGHIPDVGAIAPGSGGAQPPPGAGGDGGTAPPPPAGIPAPAQEAPQGGPPPAGAPNGQPVQQPGQQQPRQLSIEELSAHHIELFKKMPPQLQDEALNLAKGGNFQAAHAVPILYELRKRNNFRPMNQWPRDEIRQYIDLGKLVPDLTIPSPQQEPRPFTTAAQ